MLGTGDAGTRPQKDLPRQQRRYLCAKWVLSEDRINSYNFISSSHPFRIRSAPLYLLKKGGGSVDKMCLGSRHRQKATEVQELMDLSGRGRRGAKTGCASEETPDLPTLHSSKNIIWNVAVYVKR